MKRHYLLLSAFIAIGLAVTVSLYSADGDEVDGESLSAFSTGEIKVEDSKVETDTASTTASDKTLEIAKENEDKEKEEKKKEEEKKDDSNSNKDSDLDETYSPAITGTVAVSTSLNIRTGVWGDIVGSLYNNDTLTIIGRKGDWYVAEINGARRYVHMNYVNTDKKKAGQTPVQYPWGSSSSSSSSTSVNDDKIVISKEVNDACGWGSTYPNEPPATRISSPFGYRTHPVTGKKGTFHSGVDLPCVSGSRLNALANGTVERYAYDYGGGNILTIRYDNGYKSLYMHMQAMTVKIGDKVKAGQMVGKADNTGAYTTGSHLHCTIEYNGNRVDPEKVGIPLIKK